MKTSVNERIARALGIITAQPYGQCPDYENSIDECMKVIREHFMTGPWEFSICCSGEAYIWPDGIVKDTEYWGETLAEALAEALESENE